jgi:hypothetical protein
MTLRAPLDDGSDLRDRNYTDFVSTSKESDDVKGVGERDEGLENGSAGGPKPERG